MPQRPLSRLGFQEPKSNKLTCFHLLTLRGELKPMHDAMARAHKVLKSFTPKFQQSYKSLWGNKRGRTMEEMHKELQDLDPKVPLTKKGYGMVEM